MPKTPAIDHNEMKRMLLLQLARPTKSRAVILLDMSIPLIETFLLEACRELDIVGVLRSELPNGFSLQGGFDAFVSDGASSCIDISSYMSQGVVPIALVGVYEVLQEFNPMKFEGNAFLFEKNESFHILEKLIRFLENIRYVGDKRILIQNVIKTVSSIK